MTSTLRRVLLATTVLTAFGTLATHPAGASEHGGLDAVGLAGDRLVGFRTTDPGGTHTIGTLVLDGDRFLVGIDYRVRDGLLYGVGDNGGLYTVDDRDATATKVGDLGVALEGTSFGVDVNPAADALRIVGDTGQNLRRPLATPGAPTATDTPLTNPATPPATGTVPAPGVTGVAYTNNDVSDGTGTTLFGLDTTKDRMAVVSPANAGTLAPTGALPADVGPDAGIDIVSTPGGDGATLDNDVYATVEVDGGRRLWTVDPLTGDAADHGAFGADVTDLAIAPRN